MTLSNHDLIERFLAGCSDGRAARMEIETINGVRCIVGYGWAVYAADMGDTIALFGDGYRTEGDNVGWAGYSGTTTGHLQEIKGAMVETDRKFAVADYAFEVSELRDGTPPDQIVREQEVEPRDYTGHLYRKPN